MHKPQEYVAIPRRSGIVGGLQPHHHPEIARRCLTQLSFATKWYYFRETSVEVLSAVDGGKWSTVLQELTRLDDLNRNSTSITLPFVDYEVVGHICQQQRRLTPLQIEELIQLFKAGKNTVELASHFHCSRSTVSKHIRNAGLSAREKRFSEVDLIRMQQLYESGLSLDKVGEAFQTSGTTVTKYLRGRDVRIRGRHEWEQS